jgi:hypothetical protein
MLRPTTTAKALGSSWVPRLVALALVIAATLPAGAAEPAKELSTKLQQSRSRMMGTQIEQAVGLFKEATALLAELKSAHPQHADLPKLQEQYDKLAADLEKRVTQRAERDINPMKSGLEAALRGSDRDKIKQDRDKLAAAIAKHQGDIEVAGGATGAALLASAQELVDQADGSAGAASAKAAEQPKPTAAPAAPATPAAGGDPRQINNEIQAKFRGAREMPTPEMVALVEDIKGLIAQLRAADPNHARLADYEQRAEKLVADAYARDLNNARGEIGRRIDRIEMYLERNQENERPQLQEQRKLLGEALVEHRSALEAVGPEGQELIARTEATMKQVDERIGAALAGDSLVNEWVEKLNTYNRNGAKDLTPGINSPAMYGHIKALRAEAEGVWEEYGKVEFAAGKTSELERAERFFQESRAEADRQLEYAVSSRLEEAQKRVKWIAEVFAGDAAWKTDKSKQPRRFADDLLVEAARAIDDLAECVADHPGLAALRTQHEQLRQENTARRDTAKALTFLRADKYKGRDAEELKEVAKKIVTRTFEGAEVLRLTIFSEDWKEETVTEWTDTTRSALRTRTTRELRFSAAFQDKDGVFRDFGYLNQDRKSDGTWGATYGHLTKFRAPMLKENVVKDEPEE